VQRPAILHGKDVLVPIPRLLALRITDGIFYDMVDSLDVTNSERLHVYFGYLFEQYVGRLLKWAFGEDNVFEEKSYRVGKNRKEGPDWIVIDGDTALLFECRSRRISLQSRVYGTQEMVADDIRKLLVDTVRRFPGKVDDLKAGRLEIDLSGVTNFEKIVVIQDRITFEDVIFRSEVREQLAAAGCPASEDYHIIDIEDLENVTAWNREHPMKNILAARMNPLDLSLDLADVINTYAVENSLTLAHPWLQAVSDDFFERYGIPRTMLHANDNELAPPGA
jgi:hypothetical protein